MVKRRELDDFKDEVKKILSERRTGESLTFSGMEETADIQKGNQITTNVSGFLIFYRYKELEGKPNPMISNPVYTL